MIYCSKCIRLGKFRAIYYTSLSACKKIYVAIFNLSLTIKLYFSHAVGPKKEETIFTVLTFVLEMGLTLKFIRNFLLYL